MNDNFKGIGKLLYGGDYIPEQWLENPDILEKDIEYVRKLISMLFP